MNFIKTEIEGVYIVEPRVFEDDRGYFLKAIMKKSLRKMVFLITLFRIISLNLVMA